MLRVSEKVCRLDIERYRNAPPSFHGQDNIVSLNIYNARSVNRNGGLEIDRFF